VVFITLLININLLSLRKICSYSGCNVAVEVNDFDRSSPRCPDHPPKHQHTERKQHQHNEQGKVIYHTYKWKKLRKAYAADHPLCEHCLRYEIYTPLAVVDHIKELSDGGEPYERSNLQSLCHSCHNRKTASERRIRDKGNGFKSMSDF